MFISTYFPKDVFSNETLSRLFPNWSTEKIESKVGIVSRRIAAPGETALDLAEQAALELFQKHPGMKERVDFLILCTQSPDYILPPSVCILQQRLGLDNRVGAYEYNHGCSGYIYGLAQAKGLLVAGIARNVLLLTAETYSKHINPRDRGNRAIFGDAAAATFLERDDVEKIGAFVLGTDGSGAENLMIRNGGMRHPVDDRAACKENGSGSFYTDNDLFMDGPAIFNFTIETVPMITSELLKKEGLTMADIDYVVPHQANSYILNFLRKHMRIPSEKFYINMRETGNTVSCTIPIALHDLLRKDMVRSGNRILLLGFGVGYSYGAVIIQL